jgi:hypothetical protein
MTRTTHQNRYYWAAVVPAAAEALGVSREDAHQRLKERFLPVVDGDTGEVVGIRSTTDLQRWEFNLYVEQAMAFVASLRRQQQRAIA